MHPPKLLGKIIYIVGKPIQMLIIMNSRRAYVVMVHKDKILVTQNWLGTHKTWRLPGGGLHRSEEPVQGALRELKEEVGITLQQNEVHALNNKPINAPGRFTFWLFFASPATKPNIKIDTKELVAAEWVSIEQLHTVRISAELEQALRYLHRAKKL